MFNFDLKFISIKRRLRTQKLTEGQRLSNVFQKLLQTKQGLPSNRISVRFTTVIDFRTG